MTFPSQPSEYAQLVEPSAQPNATHSASDSARNFDSPELMSDKVGRGLLRQLKRTSESYALLEPGDHVMVALSGGKDSYTLLCLLSHLIPRLPFEVRLTAVHLDQRQPGYDGRPLVEYLERQHVDFEILSEDTYSVVIEHVDERSTYCSLCSRLRRGILYTAAERLGCNKIALGHHRDDSLETFLMNLFYGGKLQAMPAKYTTDDGRFEVIRPLIECAEVQIAAFAEQAAFPILPCNLCGSQSGLKRDRMTELLSSLEREIPNVKSVMMAALGNVCPTHLLDRDVIEAWHERPAHVRPASVTEPRAAHAAATPCHTGTASAARTTPALPPDPRASGPRRLNVIGSDGI